jgi:hypothetical protein
MYMANPKNAGWRLGYRMHKQFGKDSLKKGSF